MLRRGQYPHCILTCTAQYMTCHGSPHVLRECKGATLLRFMTTNNPYTKTHKTAAERVAHLVGRGLVVPRPSVAARKIEEVGYERLRIYFLSRRQVRVPNKPFIAGTRYNDILRLYKTDEKLRNICFQGVGQFELVFRNRLSETLSSQFGSHPYFNADIFSDMAKQNQVISKAIQTFKSSSDPRAKHYRDTYTEPPIPPIWRLKEFLTFGASARMYSALAPNIRIQIARSFGVPVLEIFDVWVNAFVDLRNFSAHHDRLFNRRFQKQPGYLRRAGIPSGDRALLKAQLECLDYVLSQSGRQQIPVSRTLVYRAGQVVTKCSVIHNSEAGF